MASPFEQEIAFGYNDGPTDGILQCGGCGQEFRFDMIEHRAVSEQDDIRIFELSPIPRGSVETFTKAMSAYQEPKTPYWVPLWSFPSDQDRGRMNAIVDGILGEKRSARWIVATSSWLSGEILAARANSNSVITDCEDWFASLGLVQVTLDE